MKDTCRRRWKSIGICVTFGMLFLFCFTGCCIIHEWRGADCEHPQTCIQCGKTEGEALGHIWMEATCTTPKTCILCAQTEGEPGKHSFTWTVSSEPDYGREGLKTGTCTECGETETAAIEALIPEYKWGETNRILEFEICIDKDSTGYWIDISSKLWSTTSMLRVMRNQTKGIFGFDLENVVERFSKILELYDSARAEGTYMYASMEGYGRTWSAKFNTDENKNGFLRIKVNMLNEFNAMTDLDMNE